MTLAGTLSMGGPLERKLDNLHAWKYHKVLLTAVGTNKTQFHAPSEAYGKLMACLNTPIQDATTSDGAKYPNISEGPILHDGGTSAVRLQHHSTDTEDVVLGGKQEM